MFTFVLLLNESVTKKPNKMTTLKAKRNMYNYGICFTAGNFYTITETIGSEKELIGITIINDLGQLHKIGNWWSYFTIVE